MSQRTYEVIFIVRPDLPEDEVDGLIEQMQQGVAEAGGEVVKTEKWGKRPLAYRVAGQREGFYVLFEVNGAGDVLREMERRMKVSEPVIKVFSVRVDLERKKIAKIKHKQEHRAVRRQRKTRSSPSAADASARPDRAARNRGE